MRGWTVILLLTLALLSMGQFLPTNSVSSGLGSTAATSSPIQLDTTNEVFSGKINWQGDSVFIIQKYYDSLDETLFIGGYIPDWSEVTSYVENIDFTFEDSYFGYNQSPVVQDLGNGVAVITCYVISNQGDPSLDGRLLLFNSISPVSNCRITIEYVK